MKRLMKVITPLLMAASAALGFATLAHATQSWPHAQGRLVDVRILEDGRPATLYSRGWTWNPQRRYFEAFEGAHYAVELRNLTERRVAIVMSVDGLNVLNGQRSSLNSSEPMYVLGPWESAVIRGWRTSLDEVQQFIFVNEQVSYAARVGKANGDMGWVRVATFEEQRPLACVPNLRLGGGGDSGQPRPEAKDDGAQNQSPSAGAPEPARKEAAGPTRSLGQARDQVGQLEERESAPGTGWGERRNDHVERTEFLPAANFTDQLIFRYEYASGLQALGIFPRANRVWERDNGSLGFVRPPQ
ncbi:MAG: hypothetical protein ACRENS_13250 [Candidatus Eiseniibacteriota bacterium]